MFNLNHEFSANQYFRSIQTVNPLLAGIVLLLIIMAIPVILALAVLAGIISSIVNMVTSLFKGQQTEESPKGPKVIIKNLSKADTGRDTNPDAEYVDYEIVD